ncbi:MAG: hypothetical protein PVH61_34075 [Candidatus Aminicenantes bacterium]|jgi:hypothetical protein
MLKKVLCLCFEKIFDILTGLVTLTIGFHSPVHSIQVVHSYFKEGGRDWKKVLCLLFHDIGYIWTGTWKKERAGQHAFLSGKIIALIFGQQFGTWTAGHSKKTAALFNIPISTAYKYDKMSRRSHSRIFFEILVLLDFGFWNTGVVPWRRQAVREFYHEFVNRGTERLPGVEEMTTNEKVKIFTKPGI